MSKRRIKKRIKLGLFLIFIIAIGLLGYKVYLNYNGDKPLIPITPEPPKEVWPKVYEASFVATGDALLHLPILQNAYNKETDSYDFSSSLVYVKDIIESYDLAYYNQETVFGGKEYGYSTYPTFNSPSELGDNMVDIGFNIVSLASNHSADCKKNAVGCITNAYNYWKTKNVIFDGFNEDETMENKYNIGEINGITYGFLNYTNTLNGLDTYISKNKYIIDTYDEEKVRQEVTELRDKVDVLIVAMHWHYNSPEYSFTPTANNKKIANYLDSLGVDIILGTYSHCVQPFDILENGAIVFYSLGNFISNQIALNTVTTASGALRYHPYVGAIGMLASMNITKTVYEDGTKEIKIDNLGADLLYTYKNSQKGYLVVPFSKMSAEHNSNYLKLYEEYSGYITKLNSNITIKEAGIDA